MEQALNPSPSEGTVAIIIPAYNCAATIEKTVASCLAQTHANCHVHIVDNRSTDLTWKKLLEIRKSAGRQVSIHACDRQGSCWPRIQGFLYSESDFVTWLDADDTLDATAISHHLRTLEATPGAAVSIGSFSQVDASAPGAPRPFRIDPDPREDVTERILLNAWLPLGSWLMTRHAAQHLHTWGAWNPELNAWNERQFLSVAALEGFKVVPSAKSHMTHYRWSGNQLSRRVTRWKRHHCISRIFEALNRHVEARRIAPSDRALRILRLDRSLFHVRRQGAGPSPRLDELRGARLISAILESDAYWQDPRNHLDHLGNTLEWHASLIARMIWHLAASTGETDLHGAFCRYLAIDFQHAPGVLEAPRDVLDMYPRGLPVLVDYRSDILDHLLNIQAEGGLERASWPALRPGGK